MKMKTCRPVLTPKVGLAVRAMALRDAEKNQKSVEIGRFVSDLLGELPEVRKVIAEQEGSR